MSDTSDMNEVDRDFYRNPEKEQITVDQEGNWGYSDSAKGGFVEVELPTPPGSLDPTERLHIRDFGGMVASKIDTAMQATYLTKHTPAQVFRHYATVAKGASLMDEQALKRLEALASEFEWEPEKDEYFEMVVDPTCTLTPKRR